jgi:hypothetical protein
MHHKPEEILDEYLSKSALKETFSRFRLSRGEGRSCQAVLNHTLDTAKELR